MLADPSARRHAIDVVEAQPGILQADLAARVREAVGMAPTTTIKLLRAMEREGLLVGERVGRYKGYRAPEASAWDGLLDDLLEPSPASGLPEASEQLPRGVANTSGRWLAALVAAVVALAGTFVVLAPDHNELRPGTDAGQTR